MAEGLNKKSFLRSSINLYIWLKQIVYMNQQKIRFSALLTTHIPQRNLFGILNSLLASSLQGLEIVIIDDSKSEEISRELHAKVRNCDNDYVYLLDHEKPLGRAICLNEALTQASGTFVWAPEKADRFNDNLFKDALRRFSADPAAIWVMDYDLPSNPLNWIESAKEGYIPDDSCFIWNREVLEGRSFFFNPFLTHLHGAELAMRVHDGNVWHRTDPFFVIDEAQFTMPVGLNHEEFFRSAHRVASDPGMKSEILTALGTSATDAVHGTEGGSLLTQCRQLLAQDDAKTTLELIHTFLKKEPGHFEATQIKISALEKLRRHVEAAELKHDLKKRRPTEAVNTPEKQSVGESTEPEPKTNGQTIEHSIIVPTTGIAKNQLEHCLATLSSTVSKTDTELIVIDNASIDDTFDYLDQLKEKEFLNINVITNSYNAGFGASVNQGIEKARGNYILVLHNDAELEPGSIDILKKGFQIDPEMALVAPTLSNTDHAAQQQGGDTGDPYLLTDKADSCCFMIRKNLPIRFDEQYGLAFLEMDDFCSQIHEQGGLIAVATGAEATHNGGLTTKSMGFPLTPQRKWSNRARYDQKWGKRPDYTMPSQGRISDRLEQVMPPADPSDPPEEWRETILEFLTDEIRTQILRSDLSRRELMVIVPILLMADCRELLRTLEDRLDELELPPSMLLLFVDFYYEKNIYSRCRHYLEKAENSHPAFDLFRLKISVADKETEKASALLNKLMEKYPASPDLFALAGVLYEQSGDRDEANSFAAMANQLDPLRYPPEETAFEIKF